MNGIVGWLFFCEALHKMLFRITALFREVRSSYTLEVILSFPVPVPVLVPVPVPIPVPVPVPNYFWWISKAGITNSWIVLLLVVVSLIKLLVSSSSWSSQRQTLSFFCFKAFCSISLDWLLKKSDAYFLGEVVFSILKKVIFSQTVSMSPIVELYLDPYLIWNKLNCDFRVNDMYIHSLFCIVVGHGRRCYVLCWFGKVLLFVMRILSCVMIDVVSFIYLMASKIFWCTLVKLITEFYFSGRISRVYFVANLLLNTVVVVAYSMRRLKIVFYLFPLLTSWLVLLLILLFLVFINVTRSEIHSCFLFVVVDSAVTFLNNATFSLVWLELLVVVV